MQNIIRCLRPVDDKIALAVQLSSSDVYIPHWVPFPTPAPDSREAAMMAKVIYLLSGLQRPP